MKKGKSIRKNDCLGFCLFQLQVRENIKYENCNLR